MLWKETVEPSVLFNGALKKPPAPLIPPHISERILFLTTGGPRLCGVLVKVKGTIFIGLGLQTIRT